MEASSGKLSVASCPPRSARRRTQMEDTVDGDRPETQPQAQAVGTVLRSCSGSASSDIHNARRFSALASIAASTLSAASCECRLTR